MPAPSRILIVNEDTIIGNLVSTMLQKKGYVVAGMANSGIDAFAKSVELGPDLIIMDVNLAGSMDAIDSAHYIFQLLHIPVVFIAGTTEETKLARIKYAEPYGIIFKPFAAIEVTTIVDLALSTHANRAKMLGDLPVGDLRKLVEDNEEAVIIMDKRGRILYLNRYALWFVDTLPEKAIMRHWRDVMMFVSDSSGEELSDPITEATQHMAGAIYDASTSLVTTTSKRRKVKLAIRAIQDDHDRLIAAVMSLKENLKTYM
jgi:two-component system, response regulator PdtaR